MTLSPLPDDVAVAKKIIEATQTIALVGASERPERDSHRIMRYLLAEGFQVFPVNPNVASVLGQRCVPNLAALGRSVDTVVCFRKSELVESIALEARSIGAKHLWLQLGVINPRARQIALEAGQLVVMDRCIMVDHQRLAA